MTYKIVAFYKFVPLTMLDDMRASLKERCRANELCGTILLAPEGINATIAGSREAIDAMLAYLQDDPRFSDLKIKTSFADQRPFGKMKVRLKKEIITFGAPEADPLLGVGEYVEPAKWNELISKSDVKVIDTRNRYEVAMGTFERAIDPGTESFTEFKRFVDEQLLPQGPAEIAMFCTGGIRCEKATAYLISRGFKSVYHLEGGIIKYLEHVPPSESLFKGECYVFDNRITVCEGLAQGSYEAVPNTDNIYVKKG